MGADRFFRQLALAQPGRPGQAALTGVVCAAIGLALRLALQPIYGSVSGLTVMLPAVLIAALWAGQIAGYTTIILSIFGAIAISRQFDGLLEGTANLMTVAVGTFVVVGVFGTILAASLRSTLRNLDDTVQRLRASDTRVDETTQELRAMVEQASAGIARVGLEGQIISANARFAEILGLKPEEAIGITTRDVTHPDDVEVTRRALEAARGGSEGRIEKRYIRPDGAVVWALTSLRALTDSDSELIGFIAVVVDITAA